MMYAMTGGPSFASATAMAWELAGRPRRATLPGPGLPSRERCAACGAVTDEPVPASATIGKATFTDQDRLADIRGRWTCYACAWALSGKPPHAARMWTVACAPGRDLGPSNPKQVITGGPRPGLLLTARDDMRQVARLLCGPPAGPWCVAVAETGQKHTLPWTAVNHGAGPWRARFEQRDVASDPGSFAMLLGRSAALRAAGFTGEEVTSLDPGGKLTAERLPAWLEHAPRLEPWKGSHALMLANFMIKKDHYDDYRAFLAA